MEYQANQTVLFMPPVQRRGSYVVPLWYPRSRMRPGEQIRGNGVETSLADRLKAVDTVFVYPQFRRLGDSLMFLAVVRACLDYLTLKKEGRDPDVVIPRLNSNLLLHCPMFYQSVVVDDMQTFCDAQSAMGIHLFVLTDAINVKWDTEIFVYKTNTRDLARYVEPLPDNSYKEYSSLPARFYLTFEQEVLTVLGSNPENCIPPLVFTYDYQLNRIIRERFHFDPDRADIIYCALIAVSGQPDQKQFGIAKFIDVARAIKRLLQDRDIIFLLIVSPDRTELNESEIGVAAQAAEINTSLLTIAEPDLEIIGYILARCRLAIGNDTGLSHLASLSTKSLEAKQNPTITLYSNSDYSKWCTGGKNVFPVFTGFAEFLRRYNLSMAGDRVKASAWGEAAKAESISVDRVLSCLEQVLPSII